MTGFFGKLFQFFALFQNFIENQEAVIFTVCILLHDKVVDSLEEMLVVLRCFRIWSNTSTSKKKLKKLGFKKALLVTANTFDTRQPNSKSNGDTQTQFGFLEVFQLLKPTSKVFIYSYLVSCLSRASKWCLQNLDQMISNLNVSDLSSCYFKALLTLVGQIYCLPNLSLWTPPFSAGKL